MRLSCPACNAEASLEVLLGRDADARAVAAFIERHVVFGELLVRYIALFRPPKRRLGIARMVGLVQELMPDIERGAINRKGRDWQASRDIWRAGMETVLAKRDKESLNLPLTSHGLLYELIVGLAEKYEARNEAQREAQRRDNRPTGTARGPRNLAELADDLAAAGLPPVPTAMPASFPPYSGPSRAALAIKAEAEARLGNRASSALPPPETGAAP